MKNLAAILFLMLTLLALGACGLWDKPDFREVKWGMSKNDVKKNETAELVKEGDDVLTYRITGPVLNITVPSKDTGGEGDAKSVSEPIVTPIHYEYDLLYVFGDGKLGMAVVHLRESLGEPGEYIELFKEKSEQVSKKIGAPAEGVAAYPSGDVPRANPYETPEDICGGEYVLKHVWPTDRKRTNVSIELDKKKFSSEPDCNLSIFFESVDVAIDPVLSDQLHEVL